MNWFFKNIYIFFLEDSPTFWTWSVISLYFHWISSSIPWGPMIWELETGGVYFLLYSFNLKGSESLQESLHSWRVGSMGDIFLSFNLNILPLFYKLHVFTISLIHYSSKNKPFLKKQLTFSCTRSVWRTGGLEGNTFHIVWKCYWNKRHGSTERHPQPTVRSYVLAEVELKEISLITPSKCIPVNKTSNQFLDWGKWLTTV